MTIKARRSGETARSWTDDCYKEKLTEGDDKILFTLSMPSKGGGITEVQLQVTSESFQALALAMSNANEDAATRAFAPAVRWDLMVQTMMDVDKEHAISAIGKVLKNNVDDVVRACGTILFVYCINLASCAVPSGVRNARKGSPLDEHHPRLS